MSPKRRELELEGGNIYPDMICHHVSVCPAVVLNVTAVSKYSSSVSYNINILEYRMELYKMP